MKKNAGNNAVLISVKRKHARLMVILAAILFVTLVAALGMGRLSVSFGNCIKILISRVFPLRVTWTDMMENMVINVRLPRIIAAVLVGAALSVSGATYQAVFRNPLVSPDLLGVSSGACVGAALAILIHLPSTLIQLLALGGGFLAVILSVSIPKLFKNSSTLMLILSGVLVSGFMGSVVSMIKYLADPENELATIIYWTMGSFASVHWEDIQKFSIVLIIFICIPVALRWRLNVMALGDSEAFFLGINVKRTRAIFILCATVLTSTSICICGTIGYVGLIIPHFCRLLSGSDNRIVVPSSVLLGGTFMLLVDTLARTCSATEIPLSIFTGVFGVPLFIWLLRMQKTRLE